MNSAHYPHTCPKCRAAAYIGAYAVDCSNERCPEPAVDLDMSRLLSIPDLGQIMGKIAGPKPAPGSVLTMGPGGPTWTAPPPPAPALLFPPWVVSGPVFGDLICSACNALYDPALYDPAVVGCTSCGHGSDP